MTSKEALQHIVNVISDDTYYMDLLEEEIKVIAKDLEVLEILKRFDWLVYNNADKNDFNYYIDLNKSIKLTNEEAVKIKEWLNETNKR